MQTTYKAQSAKQHGVAAWCVAIPLQPTQGLSGGRALTLAG